MLIVWTGQNRQRERDSDFLIDFLFHEYESKATRAWCGTLCLLKASAAAAHPHAGKRVAEMRAGLACSACPRPPLLTAKFQKLSCPWSELRVPSRRPARNLYPPVLLSPALVELPQPD